jgi:hypothetical protein
VLLVTQINQGIFLVIMGIHKGLQMLYPKNFLEESQLIIKVQNVYKPVGLVNNKF